jgi:hypothetical protein
MNIKLLSLLLCLPFIAHAEIYCPAAIQCKDPVLSSCYLSPVDQQYWDNMEAGGDIVAATYELDHTNWTLENGKQSSSCIYKHNDVKHGDSFIYVHNKIPLQPDKERLTNWFFRTNSYATCYGPLYTPCPYAEVNFLHLKK